MNRLDRYSVRLCIACAGADVALALLAGRDGHPWLVGVDSALAAFTVMGAVLVGRLARGRAK